MNNGNSGTAEITIYVNNVVYSSPTVPANPNVLTYEFPENVVVRIVVNSVTSGFVPTDEITFTTIKGNVRTVNIVPLTIAQYLTRFTIGSQLNMSASNGGWCNLKDIVPMFYLGQTYLKYEMSYVSANFSGDANRSTLFLFNGSNSPYKLSIRCSTPDSENNVGISLYLTGTNNSQLGVLNTYTSASDMCIEFNNTNIVTPKHNIAISSINSYFKRAFYDSTFGIRLSPGSSQSISICVKKVTYNSEVYVPARNNINGSCGLLNTNNGTFKTCSKYGSSSYSVS